jgi:hypothetical protein
VTFVSYHDALDFADWRFETRWSSVALPTRSRVGISQRAVGTRTTSIPGATIGLTKTHHQELWRNDAQGCRFRAE